MLCDRIGILNEGRLVALGSPEQVRAEFLADSHKLNIRFRTMVDASSLELDLQPEVDGQDLCIAEGS